jgi:putative colanic acid biosynthesis glycosyltransferase WcaI
VPLRIALHDFSGFPFPAQLSRELARRGHQVVHLYCPSYVSGKGALERRTDDPETFEIEGISMGRQFQKYSAGRRLFQERLYARRLARRIRELSPDVLLSGDTPLFAQALLLERTRGTPFVFWQQDLYSVAMKRFAEERIPVVGGLVGRRFVDLERRLLQRSDAVVTIAQDFRAELLRWGLPPEKVHVIQNWAPLEELPVRPRDNAWAHEHDLVDKRVLLYSGTLGLKHDPGLLLRLAMAFRDEPEVRIVVASEGMGMDWLRTQARAHAVTNLVLLEFQPYEALPNVLAAGEALLVILEREAGRFAVPSKVLSYLCAARPLLAALPPENLAATVVAASGAGVLVAPDDADGLIDGARMLLADAELRRRLGAAAREYAESAFDIGSIGDRFERVLLSVAGQAPGRDGEPPAEASVAS